MPNTREYAWKNIQVSIGNNNVATLQEISYSMQREIGVLYGQGDTPRAIQEGNKSYEGQIAMLQSEYLKFKKFTKDFNDTFNITVTYKRKEGGVELIQKDILKYCQCAGAEFSMSQGELGQIMTAPFIFLEVKPEDDESPDWT